MVLLFQLGPGPQIMISKAEGANESWTNTQKQNEQTVQRENWAWRDA